jgi:hypothetical protein
MLNLTAGQTTALQARSAVRRLFLWVDALTTGGAAAPVGFWDDIGTIVANSRTYYGSGSLISFADLNQVADMSIPGMKVTVSGLNPDVALLVRGEVISQRPVEIDIGIFDENTRVLVGSLVPHFRGKIDNCHILRAKDGGPATIELTCESIARALTNTRGESRSQSSSKERSPTDTFYKYTSAQRGRRVFFGTPKATKKSGGGILDKLF